MPKVFKNGNSLAVTVPKAYAHDLHIISGSTINWEKTGQGLLLKSGDTKFAQDITPEFIKLVGEVMKDHESALKKLADQ